MAQQINTSWHTHEVAFVSTSQVLFRNDESPWESISLALPSNSLKPWLFSYAGAGQSTSVYYSSIIVRKYANANPGLAIGNREVYRVPLYSEQFESGGGGWLDASAIPPSLGSDTTSPSGPSVMRVLRAAQGGDYSSPWVGVMGGGTYCAQMALRWGATGATPFIGVQTSGWAGPIWTVGGAGYSSE